jgi:hypothetical protein
MVLRTAAFAAMALFAASCGSSPSGPGTTGQTPLLLSPVDGASITGPQVTFTWDAVTGATKYYQQIADNPSMQSPVETTVTNPAAVVSPASTGTWWWRVRASVPESPYYTPWSLVWSFTLN